MIAEQIGDLVTRRHTGEGIDCCRIEVTQADDRIAVEARFYAEVVHGHHQPLLRVDSTVSPAVLHVHDDFGHDYAYAVEGPAYDVFGTSVVAARKVFPGK